MTSQTTPDTAHVRTAVADAATAEAKTVATRAAVEIAAVFARYGLGYDETKGPGSRARRMTGLRRPPDRRCVVDRLSPDEERGLLRAAAARGGHWGLLVRVLVETAVRNGELCRLDVGHVAASDRLVEVHEGKGGKSRVVPVTRSLTQALTDHAGGRTSGPLFLSRERGPAGDRRLSTRRVRQVVKGAARAAGIEKRVYPHLLRHTTATRLLLDGMALHDVALFLGHNSVRTTERYAAASVNAMRRAFDALRGGRPAPGAPVPVPERGGLRPAGPPPASPPVTGRQTTGPLVVDARGRRDWRP
jgi:integrase/recombinase XerD